jgi:hypothetical protein
MATNGSESAVPSRADHLRREPMRATCSRRLGSRAFARWRSFYVTILVRPWRAAALLAELDRCDRAGGVQLGAQCRRT